MGPVSDTEPTEVDVRLPDGRVLRMRTLREIEQDADRFQDLLTAGTSMRYLEADDLERCIDAQVLAILPIDPETVAGICRADKVEILSLFVDANPEFRVAAMARSN